MRRYLLWIWFSLFLVLQGCVHATIQPKANQKQTTELKQRYYQAKTTTPDGTVIAFTVYQPQLKAGQDAPLLFIHMVLVYLV